MLKRWEGLIVDSIASEKADEHKTDNRSSGLHHSIISLTLHLSLHSRVIHHWPKYDTTRRRSDAKLTRSSSTIFWTLPTAVTFNSLRIFANPDLEYLQ
jgi:hypothetical protein